MIDTTDDNSIVTFRDFGFDEQIMEGLDSIGFETPTPIQKQIIPYIM